MILIDLLLRGLFRLTARLLFLLLVISVLAKILSFGVAFYAEQHREEVENLASRVLGTPVQIGAIETSWKGFTPRLWLRQLAVGGVNETLLLGDVLVAVNFSALPWWRDNLPVSVVLTGTRIRVERDARGKTRVVGLIKPTGLVNPPALLLVRDATIEWLDHKRNAHFEESHLDFQLLSRGNRAQLSIHSRNRDLLIRGDIEGKLTTPRWSARFWARGEQLHTSEPLQPYLPEGYRIDNLAMDFQAWSHWENGSHQSTRLQFRFDEIRLHDTANRSLAVRDFSGDMLYRTHGEERTLQLADLSLRLGNTPRWPNLDAALLVTCRQKLLGISSLDLESMTTLIDYLPISEPQQDALRGIAPQGQLERVRLALGPAPDQWLARASVTGLQTTPWKKLPGLGNLQGELFAEPDHVKLNLDSPNARIDMRPLFRAPIQLETLSGELEWHRTSPQGWTLKSNDLHAGNADLQTFSRILLRKKSGQRPFIDMQTDFHDGNGSRAGNYYPVGIMKKKLVKWLDEAIMLGRIPSGSFILHGPLASFPFHKTHDGHFEVLFEVEDLKLRYHSQWPPLEETQASVRFHNNSLVIEADHARIYDSAVESVVARIPSLKPLTHLDVTGQVDGPLTDEFRLLRETPLKATMAQHVEGIDIQGNGHMQIKLRIPFKSRNYRFQGKLHLRDAALTLVRHRLTISRLRGELEIDNHGIRSRELLGKALGADIEFSIEPGEHSTHIDAQGTIPASGLTRQYAEFALVKPTGATPVHLELDLPNGKAGEKVKETRLRIHSDLQGLALELPPPLGKRAAEKRPLDAILAVTGTSRHFRLRLGEELGLTLKSAPGEEQDLNIHLSRLPFRHWVNWFGNLPEPKGGGLQLKKARIQADRLDAYPLLASNLTLELERVSNAWQGKIRGGAIAGRFHYDSSTNDSKLSLNLDHLKLVTEPGKQARETSSESKNVPVDPRKIAALDLRSKEFWFNKAALGKLRLKTVHGPKGQLIEKLDLSGGIARIEASGAWIRIDDGSFTRLDGTLNTPDMGHFLKDALLMDFLDGSKAYFSFDLSWPGAPYQFDLASLEGRLQLDMTAGRVLNIKPGAARILGLLNVRAIGRRLQFGFKDVYEKELAFDTIMGSFQLDNGIIYTNDLEISAPSSTIRIAGSTNLASRTHDQVVTVSPHFDSTLPLAGAIVGGPTTGLVLLLAQQVLAGKLEEMQRITYSITGPWDEPEVKPLKRKKPARKTQDVSAHESTPVFRTQPAPDFLLPHHHAGERHGTKRCH